jgi:hypothetical protein
MENEHHSQVMGEELGYAGVERLVDQVEDVCVHERQRIELTNESRIIGLRMELAMWADEEKRIGERLRLAPPPGDRRSRQLQAWFAAGVALVLTVAGFFFSLLAFDPFRLGWKSYLYCLGIAVVSPFCVEKYLKEWDCRQLIKGAATIACAAALASLVLLAVIRGDLVGQQLKDAETRVVITDDAPAVPQNDNRFYEQALPLLQLVMALLAVAMELGAGLALHDAKRLGSDSGEDSEKVARERMQVRLRMAALLSRMTDLSNEGPVFEARFWRDFYRAMLTHTARKALGKLLAFGLCFALVGAGALRADEQRLNLVVLLDLSASVASKGPDGKTDLQKNVAAVTELLTHVPAGSHITILGITANSFAEPDILLRADIPCDAGYFGERLTAAHRQLVRAWQQRVAAIAPDARQTDVLGALLVASQIFRETPSEERNVLITYSDMRQATAELNLERSPAVSVNSLLIKVEKPASVPDLKGIEVYDLGVDAADRDALYWERLRQFWNGYFETAGAHLRSYSVLRDPPGL